MSARWSFRFGARGWWFVCRAYSTAEEMRAAGVRYGVAEASGATGLLQYSDGRPANRCAGVMRVSMVPDTDGEFDAQMLMHELVHAACRVYRLTETNRGPVHLGWSPGTAEEAFAHIYDELWNSFQAAWVRGDPEGWEVKVASGE